MSSEVKILPVLLAGGGGTRLWPVSRDNSPKQFQRLTGPLSTYQLALQRASDPDLFLDPIVITSERYRFVARRTAAEVGASSMVVAEPLRRDSAAAMAVATVLAEMTAPGGVVLALAADQLINDTALFLESVRLGRSAAQAGNIVVFGIPPTAPLTNYGYIRPGEPLYGHDDLCRVEAFVEKPDLERAKAYLDAGYLWNSGNFLFRSDVMLKQFEMHAPDILAAAREAVAGASESDGILSLEADAFGRARRTSIDYAVIEKTRDIAVVKGYFPWSDIGSWAAIADIMPYDASGNTVYGKGAIIDSRNCLVHSEHMLTAAVGVQDLAIIVTGDAVLVIPKSRSQEVKAIVEGLQARAAPEADGGNLTDHDWGSAETLATSRNFGLRHLIVDAGRSCTLQAAAGLRWIVACGTAAVSAAGRQWTVEAGDFISGVAGSQFEISAQKSMPLELLEVRIPPGD